MLIHSAPSEDDLKQALIVVNGKGTHEFSIIALCMLILARRRTTVCYVANLFIHSGHNLVLLIGTIQVQV